MRFMTRRGRTSTRFSCVLELDGPLDAGGAARRRCRRCCERHASLRAGFQHEDLSRPVQIVVSACAPPWRSIDLSELDEAGAAAAA